MIRFLRRRRARRHPVMVQITINGRAVTDAELVEAIRWGLLTQSLNGNHQYMAGAR